MEQVPPRSSSPSVPGGVARRSPSRLRTGSEGKVGGMKTFELEKINDVREMVAVAHAEGNPVVVYDGADEALVAMSPAVFERFLTDGAVLGATDRTTFRL